MLEKLPGVLGHVLREQRAGLDKIVFNQIEPGPGTGSIKVASLAFADHAPIPAEYTADGAGVSPPLQWIGVPDSCASLVLIVEDADAPTPQPLVHAIVVDLPPRDASLDGGALQSPDHDAEAPVHAGRNSYLSASWLPPDPPPGHGEHRYVFQVFALAAGSRFGTNPGRSEVMDALREGALASGYLIGTYARPDTSLRSGEGEAVALA